MPRKTRNLLRAGMKMSIGRCYDEIKTLSPDLSSRPFHEKLMHIFWAVEVPLYF